MASLHLNVRLPIQRVMYYRSALKPFVCSGSTFFFFFWLLPCLQVSVQFSSTTLWACECGRHGSGGRPVNCISPSCLCLPAWPLATNAAQKLPTTHPHGHWEMLYTGLKLQDYHFEESITLLNEKAARVLVCTEAREQQRVWRKQHIVMLNKTVQARLICISLTPCQNVVLSGKISYLVTSLKMDAT